MSEALTTPAEQTASASLTLRQVPRLIPTRRVGGTPSQYSPSKEYSLRYRAKYHQDLPHVVKFSGGRSSGMLLFALLENNILDPGRGDVIIFNNTSAEHPDTYRFVRDCADASERYGVPFYWVQFQTYEDARNGEWTRLPAYRLVNDHPKSPDNPDGFEWRGEVFEELLSWAGYVPNQFSRICTQNMKLEVTRLFLTDWLASKESIPHLGHFGSKSRMDIDTMYLRHRRNRGAVPKELFAEKRSYVLTRPHARPEQSFANFSPSWQPFDNPSLKNKTLGGKAKFGKGGVEYIAFIGLRGDEERRVKRVEARNEGPDATGYEGEHVYMPLAEMAIGREDANDFWDLQDWDLSLPKEGTLSNCVYCFLKGISRLEAVHQHMTQERAGDNEFGPLDNTPCDLDWWVRLESLYGRDLVAEQRETRSDALFLGFFGNGSKFNYRLLADKNETDLTARFGDTVLPCDCTE